MTTQSYRGSVISVYVTLKSCGKPEGSTLIKENHSKSHLNVKIKLFGACKIVCVGVQEEQASFHADFPADCVGHPSALQQLKSAPFSVEGTIQLDIYAAL